MHLALHQGVTLPLTPPRITTPEVSFLRPSGVFTVDCFDAGSNQNALSAWLLLNDVRHALEIVSFTALTTDDGTLWATEAGLRVPQGLALPNDDSHQARLFVVRSGVHSNIIGVTFIDAPRIDDVERVSLDSDALIKISGDGFTSGSASPSVKFNDVSVTPASVSASEIQVAPPAGLTGHAVVFVVIDGKRSNPGQFAPLVATTGQAVLPPNSPLQLATLKVFSPTGLEVAVQGTGQFAMHSELRPVGSVELVDANRRVVLMGYQLADQSITLNAQSTAVALMFEAVRRSTDSEQDNRILLESTLVDIPEVSALGAAIAQQHPSHPLLEDQFEHSSSVRDAYQLARAKVFEARLGFQAT